VELHFAGMVRGSDLAIPLQACYGVDEGRMRPRLRGSVGLGGGDNVGGGLFYNAEGVEFQLANDGGLPRPGRAGDDVPSQLISCSVR